MKNAGTLYGELHTPEQIAMAVLPPSQGPRHLPVPHIEVINSVKQALNDLGINVDRERYNMAGKNVGIDGKVYHNTSVYGVLNISPFESDGNEDGEYTKTIGFQSNNMRKKSIRLIAGRNVTVCDNGIFSGDEILGRKLHTKNLSLMESLHDMLDAWINEDNVLDQQIEIMRNETVTMEEGKAILFDLFNKNVLPLKCFRDTASTLYAPDDSWTDVTANQGTLWGMHNAVTRVLRPMDIHKQMEYSGAATEALVAAAGA